MNRASVAQRVGFRTVRTVRHFHASEVAQGILRIGLDLTVPGAEGGDAATPVGDQRARTVTLVGMEEARR